MCPIQTVLNDALFIIYLSRKKMYALTFDRDLK